MVGAGIFINPPLMAQYAGSLSYLGWLIGALLMLPLVLSVATIAQLIPGEGGFYNYSKRGLGEKMGFISGWVYVLGYAATQALQMIAFRDLVMYQWNPQLFAQYPILFNALCFGIIVALNTFNLAIIGRIQSFVTIYKLLPIILFGLSAVIALPALLIGLFGYFRNSIAMPTALPSLQAALSVVPFSIFGYWGFEGCTSISNRIKNSKKNASRAILYAFSITALIYTLAHLGLLVIMGVQGMQTVSITQFANFLPVCTTTKAILTFLVTSAIFAAYASAIYGNIATSSFLMYSMAEEDLLFWSSTLKKTNRNDQPVMAILFQSCIAFVLSVFITNKNTLAVSSNLAILCSFVLTLCALYKVLKSKKSTTWLQVVMTYLAFASCALLAYYSIQCIQNVREVIPFICIVVGGIAMYSIQMIAKKKDE